MNNFKYRLKKLKKIVSKLFKTGGLKILLNRKILLNYLLQRYDIKKVNIKPKSGPSDVVFSLSNVCNLSCPMCSINNLKEKCVAVTNLIKADEVKKFSELLSATARVSFMGFNGESIINPDFSAITFYLKKNFKTFLHVSTNGNGLHEKTQDNMLDVGFDSVTFSIHAFTPDTYKILQAGDLGRVKNNLSRLLSEKKRRKLKLPFVTVVFALNKANIDEAKSMLEWVGRLGVDAFHVYHFHDYTARLNGLVFGKDEFSLANNKIDELYDFAKSKGFLNLLPEKRPYYALPAEKEETAEKKCYQPWTGLQMRSSFSHKDCYYLGCCNVFNAFLFNYREHINSYGKVEFNKIWHHPVMQYLRQTVNSSEGKKRNPLCAYCQSQEREYYKNTDRFKNYQHKLVALDEFFEGYKQFYQTVDAVSGLEILFTEDAELKANVS